MNQVAPEDIEIVRRSGIFIESWYCERYPDVKIIATDPLEHYMRIGILIGRSFNPYFNMKWYNDKYGLFSVSDLIAIAKGTYSRSLLTENYKTIKDSNADVAPVAVICHFFYPDLIEELCEKIDYITCEKRLYLTVAESLPNEFEKRLRERYPYAKIQVVKNVGRDILPFFQLFPDVMADGLTLFCKVHTKRGKMDIGDLWRRVLLGGVLPSQSGVATIIKQLVEDPQIGLVGSATMYKSAKAMTFGNQSMLQSIWDKLYPGTPIPTDWGFVAGTMFWGRTAAYSRLADVIAKEFTFEDEKGEVDGTLSHSIERLFGAIAAHEYRKVGLVHNELGITGEKIFKIYDNDVKGTTELPSLTLKRLAPIYSLAKRSLPIAEVPTVSVPTVSVPPLTIRGNIDKGHPDKPSIRGWIARVGDHSPREAIIYIDKTEICLTATLYRADLASAGIGAGCHAFDVAVPLSFVDGAPHDVKLVDKETGRIVSETRRAWERPPKKYSDFSGYLAASYTNPVVYAPFDEVDKRCFATMENITRFLMAKAPDEEPLVSVVMPAHNREDTIADSIVSIVRQLYENFELIIVDDGSKDRTSAIAKSFNDERVRVVRSDRNGGASYARNIALRQARGEIITFLDSDNTHDPRFLRTVVGAFSHIHTADALYFAQYIFNAGNANPSAIRYGSLNKSLLSNNNYIDLNVFCIKRKIVERYGYFDTDLKRYVDWDLILRYTKNARVYSVPALISNYYLGKANNTITDNASLSSDYHVVRNKHRSIEISDLTTGSHSVNMSTYEFPKGISIIVVSYESLEDTRECIESIAKIYGNKVEIVVVDNNSQYDVKKYLSELSDRGIIKLILNSRNYGFSYAVNQAVQIALPGNDILLLNNDAIMAPGCLEALQRVALAHLDVGVAVPQQILPGGTPSINEHVPYANPAYDCDVNLSIHHDNIINPTVFHDGEVVEISFAPFFCAYIKRDVFIEAGGMEAEYGRHYRSDRIFCNIVRGVLGLKIVHVSSSLVFHKLQRSTEYLKKNIKINTSEDPDFTTMFSKNRWTERERKELGYQKAAWDT